MSQRYIKLAGNDAIGAIDAKECGQVSAEKGHDDRWSKGHLGRAEEIDRGCAEDVRGSVPGHGRAGTKVDLWLIHTQEGNGNADSLAHYLQGNVGVSYHYTISEDVNDRGVTVCDVVDTDLASWSVLTANNRSINLCFAGSRTAWTRAQWMQQSRAIDVAAYLCVKDCLRYGIPVKVMPWGKYSSPGGITDHHYVTQYLGIGTHTDCGPNFPWDYFTQRIQYYVDALKPTPPPPTPPPDPGPVGPADDQLTMRWNMLGGQTLVEAVAEIRDKVLGTNDRQKPGVAG